MTAGGSVTAPFRPPSSISFRCETSLLGIQMRLWVVVGPPLFDDGHGLVTVLDEVAEEGPFTRDEEGEWR